MLLEDCISALSHTRTLTEHGSCQGAIKMDSLQWWLLKITNGNREKGLEGILFIISNMARRREISWTSKSGGSGATNASLNPFRQLHLHFQFIWNGKQSSLRNPEAWNGLFSQNPKQTNPPRIDKSRMCFNKEQRSASLTVSKPREAVISNITVHQKKSNCWMYMRLCVHKFCKYKTYGCWL